MFYDVYDSCIFVHFFAFLFPPARITREGKRNELCESIKVHFLLIPVILYVDKAWAKQFVIISESENTSK